MTFLRCVIGLFAALLFSALSVVAMPVVPTAAHQAELFPHQETSIAEHSDLHVTARAPPLAAANVAITGASVVGYGDGLIVHGHETHVASLGFDVDFDAPNRIVSDEILDQADLDRFASLRNDLGLTSNNQLRRNVALGESYVDGADIGEIVGVSGRRGPGVEMPESPIFTTTTVGHPRNLGSEVFVLENLAQRMTPQSTGTIRLLSERTVCASCQGVITQFREMFPNINLIVRSGGQ